MLNVEQTPLMPGGSDFRSALRALGLMRRVNPLMLLSDWKGRSLVMGKFLLGLITGAVLFVLILVIGNLRRRLAEIEAARHRRRLHADSAPLRRRSRKSARRVHPLPFCRKKPRSRWKTSGACCATPPPIRASKPWCSNPRAPASAGPKCRRSTPISKSSANRASRFTLT